MSQPVGWPGNGIELGGRVRILTGIGDPNTSATADVKSAAYGSIFLRADNVDGGSPQIAIREERARRDAKEIAQIKFENLCAPLRRLRGFKDRRPLYSFEFDWRPTGPCCRTFPGRWK
jgi:hypothetical protein